MVNTMFYPIKFGQILAGMLHLAKNLMSFLLSAQRAVACCLLLAVTTALVHGQTNYAPQGNEYPVIGTLPSDQVFPSVRRSRRLHAFPDRHPAKVLRSP